MPVEEKAANRGSSVLRISVMPSRPRSDDGCPAPHGASLPVCLAPLGTKGARPCCICMLPPCTPPSLPRVKWHHTPTPCRPCLLRSAKGTTPTGRRTVLSPSRFHCADIRTHLVRAALLPSGLRAIRQSACQIITIRLLLLRPSEGTHTGVRKGSAATCVWHRVLTCKHRACARACVCVCMRVYARKGCDRLMGSVNSARPAAYLFELAGHHTFTMLALPGPVSVSHSIPILETALPSAVHRIVHTRHRHCCAALGHRPRTSSHTDDRILYVCMYNSGYARSFFVGKRTVAIMRTCTSRATL